MVATDDSAPHWRPVPMFRPCPLRALPYTLTRDSKPALLQQGTLKTSNLLVAKDRNLHFEPSKRAGVAPNMPDGEAW